MKNTKWGKLAIYMFGLWSLMTATTCFQKCDFMNLTMAILGLFMLLDPQQIKQSYLRMLVWAFIPSQFYDIAWLYHKHSEFYNDKLEGGLT